MLLIFFHEIFCIFLCVKEYFVYSEDLYEINNEEYFSADLGNSSNYSNLFLKDVEEKGSLSKVF